jgi:hypothetical protein
MKTLLSLFDYSGTWSEPFAAAGWDVIQWDIKLDAFMDINLFDAGSGCNDIKVAAKHRPEVVQLLASWEDETGFTYIKNQPLKNLLYGNQISKISI